MFRDLSPASVLFGEDGFIRLSEFSLATEQLDLARTFVG